MSVGKWWRRRPGGCRVGAPPTVAEQSDDSVITAAECMGPSLRSGWQCGSGDLASRTVRWIM